LSGVPSFFKCTASGFSPLFSLKRLSGVPSFFKCCVSGLTAGAGLVTGAGVGFVAGAGFAFIFLHELMNFLSAKYCELYLSRF